MNSYASKASSELAWLFVALSNSSADPLCCSLSCNKKFTVDFETHKQFVYLHKLSISLVGVEITPIATTTQTRLLQFVAWRVVLGKCNTARAVCGWAERVNLSACQHQLFPAFRGGSAVYLITHMYNVHICVGVCNNCICFGAWGGSGGCTAYL